MSAPAYQTETPREHLERVRRDVAEGRLRAQELIRRANRELPLPRASAVLTAVLLPERRRR